MLRRRSLRRSHRSQWFDALAAFGRKQPDTVVLERSDPVGMAQNRCQARRVGVEARLCAGPIVKIHTYLPAGSNLHCYQTAPASQQAKTFVRPRRFCDSVGLELKTIKADPQIRFRPSDLLDVEAITAVRRRHLGRAPER